MNIKKIIAKQKTISRKIIASNKIRDKKDLDDIVSNEKAFLKCSFGQINTIEGLMSLIHDTKHKKASKAQKYTRCKLCKKIAINAVKIDHNTSRKIDTKSSAKHN